MIFDIDIDTDTEIARLMYHFQVLRDSCTLPRYTDDLIFTILAGADFAGPDRFLTSASLTQARIAQFFQ
jgi:hypothetical protein